MARAGDTAAAERLAAELDKAFPLDTLVQRYWLPTIRAGVALRRKDPRRAIELLQPSSPIELGNSIGNIYLCPVYLRGETYLTLQDGNAAVAEFQKFIDHRGVVDNFPWGALARLGLARAYATQGDTSKARSAYQDFLTLWKNADRVPILKQAKTEYARLQNQRLVGQVRSVPRSIVHHQSRLECREFTGQNLPSLNGVVPDWDVPA